MTNNDCLLQDQKNCIKKVKIVHEMVNLLLVHLVKSLYYDRILLTFKFCVHVQNMTYMGEGLTPFVLFSDSLQ